VRGDTTRAKAIDRALPFAAIGVGITFAIVSWIVVDRWVYPALVERQLEELAHLRTSADVVVETSSSLAFGSSVFSVALWPLSIAATHVLAGVLLFLLGAAPLRVRLAILAGSVGARCGWSGGRASDRPTCCRSPRSRAPPSSRSACCGSARSRSATR
jgi:hypothetical protein